MTGTDLLLLGSSSFPLSPLIPKNFWGYFAPAQLLFQAEQVKGMSSEERQGAQHQLWGGSGFLGAGQGHRRIPIPKGLAAVQGGRAGAATLRPKPVDIFTGDKGKDKTRIFISTGQSLGSKIIPCWQSLGQHSGTCWTERGGSVWAEKSAWIEG